MLNEVPYTQAIVSKYPEQIVIGIARDDSGKYNPITLGWTMIVSHSPPMMAVAIGKTRHSLGAFRRAGEFVIAFPSESQEAESMLFGSRSGRDTDKLAASATPVEPAGAIDCVLMSDAVANFECRLTGEFETGDHVVFFGEIIRSHVNPAMPNRLYTVGEGFQMGGLPRGPI